MAFRVEKFGDYRERRTFSKINNSLVLSDLLEIQKKSYDWFLKEGIKEVFTDLFPVESFSQNLSLEFGEYHLEDPKYTVKEAKDKDGTYGAPLKVAARLFNHETGEVKEQEIYLGEMPLMTDSGTFVINGAERAIISQLVRSPGVYLAVDSVKRDKNGGPVFTAQLIPSRGTWLEYEVDAREVMYVRIDRTRKVTVTTLLRAFGLSNDNDIIGLFGEDDYLNNTIHKDSTKNTDEALLEIYEKLRPGEPVTLDSAKNQLITRFFDGFIYDLAKVGRYKYNMKLNITERLLNTVLAEDIKDGKTIVCKKGTKLTKEELEKLKPLFAAGYGTKEVKINNDLDTYNKVQMVKVFSPSDPSKILNVIGNDQTADVRRLTISDVYASVSYYLNILNGVGSDDEIDNLSNRRVRQVGELLQNQFRVGVKRTEKVVKERMTTQETNSVTPKTLINIRPITAIIKEFFGSSQLSQFMDQTNPMAALNNKRRLSALGPGGLSRDRAAFEVRDVNVSHYGRICPIESPEGPNIGLITSLASYAKVDEYGFIMTPYCKVINKKITGEVKYMTAGEEKEYYIATATANVNAKGELFGEEIPARYFENNVLIAADKIEYIDVSAQQIVSITTAAIPFLEHDDANRTLMGANMQRQAVPLLVAEAPTIGTGIECVAAKDSGVVSIAKEAGVVSYVDAERIIIKKSKGEDEYVLANFDRSNQATCYNQRPIVKVKDKVMAGQIIADGPSTDQGEIAIGRNVVVAFMTFNGYNYEDAIILSERLVKDDVYTSLKIEDYDIECRDTKLGPEEITRDIPNVSEESKKNLDADGIVRIGTEVKEGDILIGKVTPKGMVELTSEEKLLHAIFGEKTREVRNSSLVVPHGADGVVHDIKVFTKKDCDELPAGVSKRVVVHIIQKRKISVGDKMAGRHGNKGVISLILPEEDMPYLPDGTPVDILLNPLGVPSRMNIGQILEVHLGMAAKKLGVHVATPVFDGATTDEISEMLKEANMDEDGKTVLYNGLTGEPFDHKITVGVMYMLKLTHMVDDKLHARSIGPYSLVTQQPLGGKAQFGGQRFGEMEVWALYAYGAAHTLQEILTVKSDDVIGRVKVYEAIVKGKRINQAGIPESFRVLIKEFQALGLDVSILNDDKEFLELKELEAREEKEDNIMSIQEIDDADRKLIEEADKVEERLKQEKQDRIDEKEAYEEALDEEEDEIEEDSQEEDLVKGSDL